MARIELTEANSAKLEKARPELNMSVNELANVIIESVDYVEIMTMVKVKIKKTEDVDPGNTTKPKLLVYKVEKQWRF